MTRLEVELPVCPEASCGHVGKLPHREGLKGYCVGSPENGTAHRKRRMVPVTFTAPRPDPNAGGAS